MTATDYPRPPLDDAEREACENYDGKWCDDEGEDAYCTRRPGHTGKHVGSISGDKGIVVVMCAPWGVPSPAGQPAAPPEPTAPESAERHGAHVTAILCEVCGTQLAEMHTMPAELARVSNRWRFTVPPCRVCVAASPPPVAAPAAPLPAPAASEKPRPLSEAEIEECARAGVAACESSGSEEFEWSPADNARAAKILTGRAGKSWYTREFYDAVISRAGDIRQRAPGAKEPAASEGAPVCEGGEACEERQIVCRRHLDELLDRVRCEAAEPPTAAPREGTAPAAIEGASCRACAVLRDTGELSSYVHDCGLGARFDGDPDAASEGATAHPQPDATGAEVATRDLDATIAAIRSLQPSQLEVAKEVMVAAVSRLTADNAALRARLDAVRAAVIACAYCGGVGAMLHLPGDVVEPCPACGGLRQAIDPEGTAERLRALAAKVDGIAQPGATGTGGTGDAATTTDGRMEDAWGRTAEEAAALYKQDRAELAFWIRHGDMDKAREALAAIDARDGRGA